MMDDSGFILLALLILAIPVLGVIGFFLALGQRQRAVTLTERVDHQALMLARLGHRLDEIEAAQKALAERPRARAAKAAKAALPEVVAPPVIETPAPAVEAMPRPPEAVPAEAEAAIEAPAPPPPAREAAAAISLEERITARWFVWVGAVALALAGLFLVKYAIDYGLLTPRMRVALGFLFGVALMVVGERARQRPLSRAIAAVGPDYVPGALVSAGLFSAYAAIYAGYALFGFIDSVVAFIALAAISFLGFLLGALHAAIVAVIGLVGALATPALIESEVPSALALFGYLAAVVAAATALSAYRGWTWLEAIAAAGGLGWLALWIGLESADDVFILCGFAAYLVAATLWFALQRVGGEGEGLWRGEHPSSDELVAWTTALLAAVIMAWAVVEARNLTAAAFILAAQMLAAYAAARRFARFDGLAAFAGLAPFLVAAGWPKWEMVDQARAALAGAAGAPPFTGLVAPPLQPWMAFIVGLTLLVLIVGQVCARGAGRPQVFAASSVLTAAALMTVAYIPLRDVTPDRLWAGLSAGLALMAVAATASWNGRRALHAERLTLGIYAVATVAALSAVLVFTLRDAWLTVALSLLVPALAWIGGRLDLPEFRLVALVVASALLVRLAFNPHVLSYHEAVFLGRHWVIYGYGVPAAALYAGARLFAPQGDDRLVQVLEGGALAFALMLVSLEIRILVHGSMDYPRLTLIEASLHGAVWLVTGWWRGRAALISGRAVDRYAAMVLTGLGLACVVLMQLLALNPLVTDEPVGRWPVLDTLALAYLLPALLVAGLLWQFARLLQPWMQRTAAGLALGLGLVWMTLEVRHIFHGERIGVWRHTGDAESWTVSAVWIAAAFVLFGAGIATRAATLRHAALAILVVSVLKVFLIDMAGLEGLYRVASFLGLGLSLVAIGLLYQRFVQRPGITGEAGPA